MVSLRAEEILGEPIQPFLAQSVGIAFADTATERLRGLTAGLGGIGHDPTQALLGVGLVRFIGPKTHPLVTDFGRGLLKELAASLIARTTGTIFGPGTAQAGFGAGGGMGDSVFGGIA